jgi:LAO/AO transport system kinase
MADLVAVNKADGPNAEPARLAAQHYRSALHFFPKKETDWAPEVLTCSALDRTGLEEVWSVVQRYLALARSNGSFDERRARQRRQWFTESLLNGLHDWFFALPHIRERLGEMETAVAEGSVSPFWAAEELLQKTVFGR